MRKFLVSVCLLLIFYIRLFSQNTTLLSDSIDLNNTTLINLNNFSMWVRSDGVIGRSPGYKSSTVYPKGTAEVVIADGFAWAGFFYDSYSPALRAGGSLYTSSLRPGKILPNGIAEKINYPARTVWNIRKDWEKADLSMDAKILFNISNRSPYEEEIYKIRAVYQDSWENWPWQKGAPFYDINRNGIMDEGEKPGLYDADQVVWFVCNDVEDTEYRLFGSPGSGIELQVTLWAYNREGETLAESLNQTIFRRYRFIYKGTINTPDSASIDSMFISMWSDCDIGDYTDDYVGCDTLLDLMFGYNSTAKDKEFEKYGLMPPAIGYTLLQGPAVFTGNKNDKILYDSYFKKGYRSIGMTSFTPIIGEGTGLQPDIVRYANTWYNCANSLNPFSGTPVLDAQGNPDHFPFSDDPFTKNKDIDGIIMPAGERRMMFHSGPFKMSVGDTQDVVLATIGGIGSDNLESVSVMKYWTKWVRCFYKNELWKDLDKPDQERPSIIPTHFALIQNFPNPFNSKTIITFLLSQPQNIKLCVYNSAGQLVKELISNKFFPSGKHKVQFDARNLPSGIYFYHLSVQGSGKSRTGKMVLVR